MDGVPFVFVSVVDGVNDGLKLTEALTLVDAVILNDELSVVLIVGV